MGGRGRGGKSSSLTREQLQAMGCAAKDSMPQVQTVPPPTFPPLLNKPTKIENKEEDEQAMHWKENYLKHLHESPYFKAADDEPDATLSLGAWEKWTEIILGPKKAIPEEYDWKRMPKELQLSRRKRKQKIGKVLKTKNTKIENSEEKFKALEEKEKIEYRNEASTKKSTADSDDEEEENAQEDIAADEEMDDENDYGNSYFDNGEAYNEEDDNLDDGPVY